MTKPTVVRTKTPPKFLMELRPLPGEKKRVAESRQEVRIVPTVKDAKKVVRPRTATHRYTMEKQVEQNVMTPHMDRQFKTSPGICKGH